MKINRNVALTIVCIILGTMISWQYASVKNNRMTDSIQNKRLDELKDELLLTKTNYESLSKRNEELSAENFKYESMSGNINEETKVLSKELERVRMAAGLLSVKGKGIIVKLDSGSTEAPSDTDILSVINELRASDAQAISINDERITAMTEVRLAGVYTLANGTTNNYIMVNSKQLVAPFVIKAIADPDKLENALKIVAGVVETLQYYGIKVSVEKSDNIEIPKVRDDGSVIKTDLLTPVK